jgi:diguanylate cyclase (GGDEF)-like protein
MRGGELLKLVGEHRESGETTFARIGPGARLRAAWRAIVAPLARLSQRMHLPPDLSERFHLDQASDFCNVFIAISLIGLCSLLLLILDFMNEPHASLRNALSVSTSLCYLALIWRSYRWLGRRDVTAGDAKALLAAMVRLLGLLGILWGVLIAVLMSYGTVDQRALIYGIVIGCVATPVLVSPISCAIAFWLPVSTGALFGLFTVTHIDWFAVCDLFAFVGLTGFCIVYLNRRMNERAIGVIRLEENSAVIKLLLRDFEESASDWLWETNAALELQPVSQRLAQVAQRPAEEITGPFPQALLGEIMAYEHRPGSAIDRLVRVLEERAPFRDFIVPVIIAGEERYWSLTGKPILDKLGRFAGYHGVGSDITGQRRQQEQIAFLARHDSLTKLPNRVLFSEVLHEACLNCDTAGLALLCLDLDHFKLVNDTLGHATGDALLLAVAERLRGCIRHHDMAARLGGDEFAIILMTDDIEEAATIALRIIDRISRPFQFDGQLVQVGISIGVSVAPQDSRNPSGLMKNADLALYRAKSEGKGVWRRYDPQMDERLQERRSLQSGLRQALLREEFRLEFQPIVDLASLRVVGAEALLRWRHPERGELPPAAFITLAEESGIISQIGEWVLSRACREAARWPAEIGIAVNLSPLQFREPALVGLIDRTLSSSGIAPARLEIEITETTVLETSNQTVEALWQLHGRGVRIALDDFGTGYSSLSYLRRFPFDKIKIDRSFIRDLGFEKDDSSIILAIIGLAERMNMVVTAEGVETEEQANLLLSFGCGQAQGYLFYNPMSADEFAELVNGEAADVATGVTINY